jgi:hypothetical protein
VGSLAGLAALGGLGYFFTHRKKVEPDLAVLPFQKATPVIEPLNDSLRISGMQAHTPGQTTHISTSGGTLGVRNVRTGYIPTNEDEILFCPGDTVDVERQFEDGWAFGTNLTTSRRGMFPLVSTE